MIEFDYRDTPTLQTLVLKMKQLTIEPNNTQFSLPNAYALALASKLAYAKEAEVLNKLSVQGFNGRFIDASKIAGSSQDTQAFIAHSGSVIVIAFRGTEKVPEDWCADAKMAFRTTPHGNIHTGFDDALDAIWDTLVDTLESVHQYGQSLWLTGHSLGGALAVLAAARLTLDIDRRIYKSINGLYTFGQPRVGDRRFVSELDQALKPRYFRFVNDNDIVPRVPDRLNQYQEGGSICFFDSEGKLHEDVGYWFKFMERIKGSLNQKLDLIPSFIEHHFIDHYIQNIEKNL
ncbi:lipase family protein [Methylomonas sp. BW4-1]|uniref:lipase family protein n=1 Tax=Methylomonas sp. BW4-1 TaxID=3376685 RepID=UPI0040428E33